MMSEEFWFFDFLAGNMDFVMQIVYNYLNKVLYLKKGDA